MRKKIALALVLATAVPIPQTTVSSWTAQVVDESGAPQPSVTVTELWQNYTLEKTIHRDTSATDGSGRVTFPRRVLWRPLILNVVGTFRSKLHGSASYLEVWANRAQSFTDLCCNSRMILHPIPTSRSSSIP